MVQCPGRSSKLLLQWCKVQPESVVSGFPFRWEYCYESDLVLPPDPSCWSSPNDSKTVLSNLHSYQNLQGWNGFRWMSHGYRAYVELTPHWYCLISHIKCRYAALPLLLWCLFIHQSMFDLGIEPRSKPLIVDSYRPRMDLPFWVSRRHWLLHRDVDIQCHWFL